MPYQFKYAERSYTLSTEHAASSYGQPVLVDERGQEHGKNDLMSPIGDEWDWLISMETASQLVACHAGELVKKDENIPEIVSTFCGCTA